MELKPTSEQLAIMDAVRRRKHLVIQAGAGTGKTSTLKMLAHDSRRKATYLAYNRAAADEAKASFPGHVGCRTAHSLAFGPVGRKYAHRLGGRRRKLHESAEILGTSWLELNTSTQIAPPQVARIALDAVTRFCYSADDDIAVSHVPHQIGIPAELHVELATAVLKFARRAWSDICDRDGRLNFSHDHYLKMYALTRPTITSEVIMLDEGQDSNPVVAQLVCQQAHAQKIIVGDSCQQLYSWRGAVDALADWPADERLYLSRSWRFGPAIAAEANDWLSQLDTPLRLKGNPAIASTLRPLDTPRAVLCRTNAEAMKQVMAMLAQGRLVALVGGGNQIRQLAEAADDLKNGRRPSHPELFAFATWGELQDYVDSDPAGRDLKTFVDLIDAHGADTIIEAVSGLVDENRATTTISTVHRSKGREWDSVQIAGDFPEPTGRDDIPRADAMLAYVAVTRARKQLDPAGLAWIDRFLARRPRAAG
jgi:hypothetical protein